MVGPAAKCEGVAHLRAVLGLSERRASFIVDADRKMIRYRSRRPAETELLTRMRDLANERRRAVGTRAPILVEARANAR
jgi:putative transposase